MNHEMLLRRLRLQSRPTHYAAAIALAYFAMSSGYILLSSQVAARWSDSVQQLERIEWAKGIVFVFVTSLLLYGIMFYLLRRVCNEGHAMLRAREALSELERGATAGIILQAVVHDFRNQAQVAWGNVQLLSAHIAGLPEGDRTLVERIRMSVGQLISTLERDHEAGVRSVTRSPAPMDLPSYVAACVDLVRRHPKVADCQVRVAAGAPVIFCGHKSVLHDAMTNLVINAAEALGGKGTIEVRVTERPLGARIEVHDSGPGVPEAERERIFGAFYTSKDSGTGLGLLSVKACAKMHHGHAEVVASPLGGACFRLDLESVAPPPEQSFPLPQGEAGGPGGIRGPTVH